MSDGTYQPKVYRKQGAEEMVVANGGKITVESGGTIEIESGGALTISDGTLELPDIAVAQGSILVGDSDGEASALSAKGDGKILVGNGTTITSVAISGHGTLANDGALSVAFSDDDELVIGATTTNAETKITMEFDETTTGIGLFRMGDLSNAQVLNANPGSTVVGGIVNITHSAGAGDCDDLMGVYVKTTVSGDGDSGTTMVPIGTRAYVSADSAIDEVYSIQPWIKHSGTGTMQAGSAVSAALILNDGDAFESTNSLNSGHFHIKTASGAANGAVTSSNFDGVMIEVYGNVTGMDSLLNLSNGGTSTDSLIKMTAGTATNVLEFTAAANCVVEDTGTYSTADAYMIIKVGNNTYRCPLFSGVDE